MERATPETRIEPAVELVDHAGLDYLVFECLGERTIALAQAEKLKNAALGYDPFLLERMEAVLERCARRGVKIIANMGAANPEAAARATAQFAEASASRRSRSLMLSGDDVHAALVTGRLPIDGEPLTIPDGDILSANACLGAGPIVEALRGGRGSRHHWPGQGSLDVPRPPRPQIGWGLRTGSASARARS